MLRHGWGIFAKNEVLAYCLYREKTRFSLLQNTQIITITNKNRVGKINKEQKYSCEILSKSYPCTEPSIKVFATNKNIYRRCVFCAYIGTPNELQKL